MIGIKNLNGFSKIWKFKVTDFELIMIIVIGVLIILNNN